MSPFLNSGHVLNIYAPPHGCLSPPLMCFMPSTSTNVVNSSYGADYTICSAARAVGPGIASYTGPEES